VNAITQLDVLDLEHAMASYDVGTLVRYWPAASGIENSNYFVRTQQHGREREFVLTILEQPSNAGPAYVPLIDLCVAAGLPVPRILRNRQGEPQGSLDGKRVILSDRLGGRHVYNPTRKQVAAVGRFMARFHLATGGWQHPVPEYPRTAPWIAHHAALARRHLDYPSASLLESAVQEVCSLLARQDVAALPRGLVHGDLFRDNVLFNERGLTGVLDFHHAARGPLLFDLAVAANDWCTDSSGVLDPERTLTLLRAYHGIRPLVSAEAIFFPAFTLYAALAFWLSRLVVAVERAGTRNKRFNNPLEFERIVRERRAHFFYVDERLLCP
jgi:homoserine kinase type II